MVLLLTSAEHTLLIVDEMDRFEFCFKYSFH